jgi:hypothetical protein
MGRSEEEHVRALLESHLRERGSPAASCKLVLHDPPDIECHVNGERWAIEVTRVGEREVRGGSEKARLEIDLPLINFGRRLQQDVKPLSKRYLLLLNGLPTNMRWSNWKRYVEREVRQFVSTARAGKHDFAGGSITTSDEGARWMVVVGIRDDACAPSGAMTCDISANIDAMLEHALDIKSQKMRSLAGFNRAGLVMLNTYFFGDDVDDVRHRLQAVMGREERYFILDLIYYLTNGSLHLIYDKRPPTAAN